MIQVDNLAKSFGDKQAVRGVSFTVERGEVVGFLGPNGAGKSTTMRMITGFIPPTAGTVRVGGHDITAQPIAAKRLIGYLPENAPSYTDMTVQGFLAFCAELRGLRGDAKLRAVNRSIETCFLEGVRHQSVDTLSKGYRHRTCLAQSLIHDPEVLVLDEPTDGLDPNQKHEARLLIKRMGEKKAIIFSTHILEEVDAACTRAIIIDRGLIVAKGTPTELRNLSDLAGTVNVKIAGKSADEVKDKLGKSAQAKRVNIVNETNGVVWARVFPESKANNGALARSLGEIVRAQGWEVQSLHVEEGRLDEVFRGLTWSETGKK